jgi:hypothetical protein
VFLERRSARFSSLRNADAEGAFARSCASAYIRSVITTAGRGLRFGPGQRPGADLREQLAAGSAGSSYRRGGFGGGRGGDLDRAKANHPFRQGATDDSSTGIRRPAGKERLVRGEQAQFWARRVGIAGFAGVERLRPGG